jgi:pimeloyl-ACP methyl ester carboxylesterase
MKETTRTNMEATLPVLEGVEHRFIDLPGLRMHVAEAGRGEPIVLLHGFPEHWWEWRKVIPDLARDYRVICPDLRGAGWTDAPADGYTRDQLFADVVALLSALGLPRVHLIAHDWSAVVGFRLCFERPDLVRSFLCLATPHPYIKLNPRVIPRMRHLWFQPVVATAGIGPHLLGRGDQRLGRFLLRGFAAGAGSFSTEDVEYFLSPLRDPAHARAGSALYRGFILPEMGRIVRGSYRDSRLTTPTRMLYGLDDPGIIPELMGGYENNADDLVQEFHHGAAHFFADDRPDVVVRAARELFAGTQ